MRSSCAFHDTDTSSPQTVLRLRVSIGRLDRAWLTDPFNLCNGVSTMMKGRLLGMKRPGSAFRRRPKAWYLDVERLESREFPAASLVASPPEESASQARRR